jgi:hypothetical protein
MGVVTGGALRAAWLRWQRFIIVVGVFSFGWRWLRQC